MKNKHKKNSSAGLIVSIFTCVALTALASGRIPSTTDKNAACGCINPITGGCGYSTSTQNTLCDCGYNCCVATGNNVAVTITPYTGGTCPSQLGACGSATAGKPSSGSGTVMTSNCGS